MTTIFYEQFFKILTRQLKVVQMYKYITKRKSSVLRKH